MEIAPVESLADVREPSLAEAKRSVRQAWLRYAVLELVLVFVPLGIVTALWASEVVPGWLLAVVGAIGAATVGALAYDTVRRVRPLEREVARLQALVPSATDAA